MGTISVDALFVGIEDYVSW